MSRGADLTAHEGAEPNFVDPSAGKQRDPPNAAATRDAVDRATALFASELG